MYVMLMLINVFFTKVQNIHVFINNHWFGLKKYSKKVATPVIRVSKPGCRFTLYKNI